MKLARMYIGNLKYSKIKNMMEGNILLLLVNIFKNFILG